MLEPWLIGVGAAWLGSSAYLLGLRRFRRAAVPVTPTPDLDAPRVELVTHDVILDGISASGKSTLMMRLTSPCTTRAELLGYAATADRAASRLVPLCLEAGDRTPPRVHALRFHDTAGEKSQHVTEAIAACTGPSAVALWVWDLAAGDDNRTRKWTRDHVQACYGSDRARTLIKRVVVFLNKRDLLAVPAARQRELIDAQIAYLREISDGVVPPLACFEGSALDGEGLFDCHGALLDALGLATLVRPDAAVRGAP